MKHLLSFIFLMLTLNFAQAQQVPGLEDGESPTDWSGKVEKKSNDTYQLTFESEIKDGWHIFSQHTPEGGSLPLEIEYIDNGKGYETVGETEESPTKEQYNEIFEVDELIWEETATLTQEVKVDNARFVKAEVAYQVCEEMCINEEAYFVFDLENETAEIFDNYDDFEAFGDEVSSDSSEDEEDSDAIDADEMDNDPAAMDGDDAEMGMMMADDDMESPVEWSGEIKKNDDKDSDLIFTAKIDDGWHIFSQHTPDGGSLPLEIEFINEGEGYKTNGETKESPTKEEYNEIFEVDEVIWEEEAVLTQNVERTDNDLDYIKAEVKYQVCEELCINQEYYFVFDLKNNKVEVFDDYDEFDAFGADSETVKADSSDDNTASDSDDEEEQSMWTIFLLAFLWGFAALLTPCVFPMIPMTVSFFTKQSKTKAKGIRNAIFYAVSIIVIYVILGTLIVGVFGADSLNKLSTNVTFNIIFFLILVVFAVSFLGAFEIVLPSSWANKVDKQADRGGLIGIFFMALALAIVSFSCTGPIIGTLLVQAASQGGIAPIIGMLGFSLALAIPFALFAMFPGWMNSLPQSGGWLNAVKVVLGLLELAFAFKFLSNADLVLQAGLLPREIFLAIWIAIFGVMAFYLFGKIQLPNDSKPDHIGVGRFSLGLLVLVFTIYLIPGMWGAPLKVISGFPPPMTYSESPHGVGYTKQAAVISGGSGGESVDAELENKMVPGPHDIPAFRDYDDGVKYAKLVDKPILLDFTGMACVNCRKMEERIWSEDEILPILNNDVVLISLYVDIDEKLPKDEQYTSETTGKRIRTIGNKWSDFQIERYQMNAQPYYVLIDPETEENLNDPVAYLPDVDKYGAWLQEGINNYKE